MNIQHPLLRAQYRAALAMLKQAIEKCPPEEWDNPQDRNRSWHVIYHVLFYTHLYLHNTSAEFKTWEFHRAEYENLGPLRSPPHNLPKIAEPYTRDELLAFFEVCWNFVDQQLPSTNLEAESGFFWLPFSKLELQIYNIRHIQQHTGELMERLGSRSEIDIDWVGSLP